jgi:rubrerythrin
MAIEGERHEHTVMYPEFEKKAKEENDLGAASEFIDQASESREHEDNFKKTLELARKKFAALKVVEKIHADNYQRVLDSKRGIK